MNSQFSTTFDPYLKMDPKDVPDEIRQKALVAYNEHTDLSNKL